MQSETALRAISAVAFAAPAAAAIYFGNPYFAAFIALVTLVMAWEWVRLTGSAVFGLTGVVLALLLIGAIAAATSGRFLWAGAIVVAAVPAVYAVARFYARSHALAIAVGAIYIGLPALAVLWILARPEIGRGLVLWIICVVVATDIAAYFVGRAAGGPKLAPRISPGKTWSGLGGGVAGAVVVGVALGLALGVAMETGRILVLAASAFALALVSQMGDLFESKVKRSFRVKDAGSILPGHGGLMDRVDGIVAAQTAAALVIWIGGGDPRPWL